MNTGTVKWFDNKKGYGFIADSESETDSKDYFVHFSEIQTDGSEPSPFGDNTWNQWVEQVKKKYSA